MVRTFCFLGSLSGDLMGWMGAETLCSQRDDFRDRDTRKFTARLLQDLAHLPQDMPGRAGIDMQLDRSQTLGFPLAMGTACQPMDSLRSLHDAELSNVVALPVVLDQRSDG